MNATQLLEHFDRLAEAPGAVARLRRFILDLAVRGKLVEQDAGDEPAAQLWKRIQAEKARLVKTGAVKASKTQPACGKVNSSLIPSSWLWTRLVDVGFISPRNTASDEQLASFVPMSMIAADYGTPNRNEVRLWREIKTGYTHFAEGDVGLAKITPCFENGKSTVFRGLTNGIGAGTTELHIVRPVFLSADYILIYLKSSQYITTGIPRMTGTAGQKRVPTEYFTQTPFPLPPLAEQHRIVAKVDELMALCDQLEAAQQERERSRDRLASASLQRLNQPALDATPETQREHARFHLNHLPRLTTRIEHIKSMRQTILDLAVRGKFVAQDPVDEPAAKWLSRVQAERLRLSKKSSARNGSLLATDAYCSTIELPLGWAWIRLGDLCTKTGSGSTPAGGKEAYVSLGVPFLRSQNIYNDGLRLDGVAFISDATQERMRSTTVKAGDLLLNITGGSIGRCAIVPSSFEIGNINQHVAIIRLALLESGRYLYTVICSDYFQKHIFGNQTGAGREGLPKNRMDEILIPIPPLAEQHRIVAKVDELMALCDQLEAQLTTTQTDSRRLLEAVLEAALAPV